MIKKAFVFLILTACTTDENMRMYQATLEGNTIALTEFKLILDDSSISASYISSILDGKELKQFIEPFKPVKNLEPNILDFNIAKLDEVHIKNGGEDTAPYRIENTFIGGNHGYLSTKWETVTHDKTQIDVGSLWSDGVYNNIVLVAISGNDLYFSRQNANTGTINSPLTHVAGAANTSNVIASTFSTIQFYPPNSNKSLVLKIDNNITPISNGTYTASSDIVFEESYNLLSKNSIMNWLINNVGNVPVNYQPTGTTIAYVTNKIRYTRLGNTLENDFQAKATINFEYLWFIMGFSMTPSGTYPNLKTYIPKTLPFSQDGNNYDFANLQTTGFLPPDNNINITPARSEPLGIAPDRHIFLLDGLGFSMGYLPIEDADPAVRRARANNKFMQIALSGKIYMSAIDDDSKTQLFNGDYYKVIAYKNFFISSTNRTTYYIVAQDNGDYYLYADWHNLPYNDTLEIPIQLRNKNITLIEKSDNVSYTGISLTSELDVTITAASSYGYLILKV